MINQHWSICRLNVVRQQTITCANVDLDLITIPFHMASFGNNEIMKSSRIEFIYTIAVISERLIAGIDEISYRHAVRGELSDLIIKLLHFRQTYLSLKIAISLCIFLIKMNCVNNEWICEHGSLI